MSQTSAVIKFKKDASDDAKNKVIEQVKAAGGTIESEDNKNSKMFPFIVVKVSPEQFTGFHSGLAGDQAVEKIEEDKTFTTQ